MPAVVFVTAHDQYAIQAFEINAIDYLLKPVTGERFREGAGAGESPAGTADAAERASWHFSARNHRLAACAT